MKLTGRGRRFLEARNTPSAAGPALPA